MNSTSAAVLQCIEHLLRIDQKSLRQPRITVTPGCLEKIDSDRGGLRRYVRLRTLAGLYFIYKNSVEVLYVALSSWLAARDDCAQHQLPGNYGPAGALVRAGACGGRMRDAASRAALSRALPLAGATAMVVQLQARKS